MKFTLKDYQDEAVRDVLDRLRKAGRRWHEDQDRHAFSLTATTGAGKTVMAAAIFEALFYGNEDYDLDPDPRATVIWFSDDPALNEQSRYRLMESSDRLHFSDLIVVENTFNREKFEPGKIYFLNTQKFQKNSLLVRGHDIEEELVLFGQTALDIRPDMRSYTIWDTIQNTIEDPDRTVHLVLDEAHRGMAASKSSQKDRSTIVSRLINGHATIPPVPVVWGISATIERFNTAMAEAQGRSTLPNVVVDPAKVQASGLLKDTIILDIPDEVGHFDTVLVRRATQKIIESSKAWLDYAALQTDADIVQPLMVLQVPNTPDPDDVARALKAIYEEWPHLPTDAIAHVLGDHTTHHFGPFAVPYISPERVQDSTWVRVLIAKDAISTGWDCPRAEVLVSFRPAKDKTHITQLLGRMIRTPLARRIPGNERLNAVDCLLPFFDAKSVEAVADALTNGTGPEDPPLPGRRVLINPIEVKPNEAIHTSVWEKFLSLPSQALPQRAAKPVKRLTALAQELASDELLPDAGKNAHAQMHQVLDAARVRYRSEILAARTSVLAVEGRSLILDQTNATKTFDQFVAEADVAVIEDAYRRASRILGADLARTYAEHLADSSDNPESIEDALLDAHTEIAALGMVSEVKEYLDIEATRISNRWFDTYRADIRRLSDERQDAYREIKEMSSDPQDVDLTKPSSWMVHRTERHADGTESDIPAYEHHLLSNEEGTFPMDFGSNWEEEVLTKELQRTGFVAWYRNPSRASQDSLAAAYQHGSATKMLRPDFVFFSTNADGSIGASIVDPHGIHFEDALPKLRGLADYAEQHANHYQRIDAVAKVGESLQVLDLTSASARQAVRASDNAKSLYESPAASTY